MVVMRDSFCYVMLWEEGRVVIWGLIGNWGEGAIRS